MQVIFCPLLSFTAFVFDAPIKNSIQSPSSSSAPEEAAITSHQITASPTLAVMNTSGLAEKRQSQLLLNELNLLYMHKVIENRDASAAPGLIVAALRPHRENYRKKKKIQKPDQTKGCV